jgi:hypothetical protein
LKAIDFFFCVSDSLIEKRKAAPFQLFNFCSKRGATYSFYCKKQVENGFQPVSTRFNLLFSWRIFAEKRPTRFKLLFPLHKQAKNGFSAISQQPTTNQNEVLHDRYYSFEGRPGHGRDRTTGNAAKRPFCQFCQYSTRAFSKKYFRTTGRKK